MSSNLFYKELQIQFDRLMQVKERLDGKINSTITTSGIITTLFMGFGIFLIRDIVPPNFLFLIPAIIVLILEISLTAIAIKFAVEGYRLKAYYYPITSSQFQRNYAEFDEDLIKKYLNADVDKLTFSLTKSYLKCIRDNKKANAEKVKKIDRAQDLLIVAISLIPIFAGLVISAKFVMVPPVS